MVGLVKQILANLKDAIEGWLEVANSNHSVELNTQIVEIAVSAFLVKQVP